MPKSLVMPIACSSGASADRLCADVGFNITTDASNACGGVSSQNRQANSVPKTPAAEATNKRQSLLNYAPQNSGGTRVRKGNRRLFMALAREICAAAGGHADSRSAPPPGEIAAGIGFGAREMSKKRDIGATVNRIQIPLCTACSLFKQAWHTPYDACGCAAATARQAEWPCGIGIFANFVTERRRQSDRAR